MNYGIKATVARTTTKPPASGPPRQGTAFLVSKNIVVTCAHCLGTKESFVTQVDLHFSCWSQNRDQIGVVIEPIDWEIDIALVRLQKEAQVDPLPWAEEPQGLTKWESFGHPQQVLTDGIVFSGEVKDANALFFDQHVLQLHCAEARDKVGGASGSPVVVGGEIVGVLTHQLLQRAADGMEKVPAFEALYALPLESVLQAPWFASHVPTKPSSRHERIIHYAKERLAGLTRERVDSERKYNEDRYVNRTPIQVAFAGFMNQFKYRCFLAIGKAGAGKTATLSHLALHATSGPALFVRGGIEQFSKEAISDSINTALASGEGTALVDPPTWANLMKALHRSKQELVVFIDAINETEFTTIKSRRAELELLLEFASKLPIRIVVSCRDVFWTYFIDTRGQSLDFWWNHVYDPRYEERLQTEITRHRDIALKQRQATTSHVTHEEISKREEQIRKAAVQATAHHPSALIGDFSKDELQQAIGNYGITVQNKQLLKYLEHPLLLQLCSELAENGLLDADSISLNEVFARYVDFKIAAVNHAHPSFDPTVTERLLSGLTGSMRSRQYAKATIEELDKLVAGDKDAQAIRAYLLDEGIILELKTESLVGYQYDALFEHMLCREIMRDSKSSSPNEFVERILPEVERFESMVGALEFFFADCESRQRQGYVEMLQCMAKGNAYAKATFLRMLLKLTDQSYARLKDSVATVFSDHEVDEDLALAVAEKVVNKGSERAATFVKSFVASENYVGLGRCTQLVGEFKSNVDLAVALELLKSTRLQIAFSAAQKINKLLESGSLSEDDVVSVVKDFNNQKMSFHGMQAFIAIVLPRLVVSAPKGRIAQIVETLCTRPEFKLLEHSGTLLELTTKLLKVKSEDLVLIVNNFSSRPAWGQVILGLIIMAQIESPKSRVWLISSLFRENLSHQRAFAPGLMLLISSHEQGAGVADEVAGELSPEEARQMWDQVAQLGILPGRRDLSRFGLIVPRYALYVMQSVAFYLLCFQLLLEIWQAPSAQPVSAAFLVACMGFGALSFLSPVRGTFALRRKCSTILIAIVVTLTVIAWHPPALIVAVSGFLILLGLAPIFRKGFSFKVVKGGCALILIGAALGLIVAQPVTWMKGTLHWSLIASLVGCAFLFLEFLGPVVLGATALAPSISTIIFMLCDGAIHRGKTPGLISLLGVSVAAMLGKYMIEVVRSKPEKLRGIGGLGGISFALVIAATATAFGIFGCWAWVMPVLLLGVVIYLPVPSTDDWLVRHVFMAVFYMIIGALIGVLTWWTWQVEDGRPGLYASFMFWSVLELIPFFLTIVATIMKIKRGHRGLSSSKR